MCLLPLVLAAPLLLRVLLPLPSAALAVVRVESKLPPLAVPTPTAQAQVVAAAAVTTLPGSVDPQRKVAIRCGPRVALLALPVVQAATVARLVLGKLAAAVAVVQAETPAVVRVATAVRTALAVAVAGPSHRLLDLALAALVVLDTC